MLASKLMPGILFTTSDVGIPSAKLSALIYGMQYRDEIAKMEQTVADCVRKQLSFGDKPYPFDLKNLVKHAPI